MAGTTISTSVTVGVTLTSAAQNPVTVTSTGAINVSGSYVSAIYADAGIVGTINNSGTLTAANGYGIRLHWGGSVTNGSASDTNALISGGVYGIRFDIHGPGTLTNFGTVSSANIGVFALSPTTVTNGSASDKVASITGYGDGVDILGLGTVTNLGTITATGTAGTGVYLRAGGSVTNGSTSNSVATISGGEWGVNIEHAAGTVTNFGTITGTGPLGRGVVLNDGGLVTNGGITDKTALINAGGNKSGIYIGSVAGTVVNFGTVMSGRSGVALVPGGTVTNGSTNDTSALISGARDGVYLRGDVASAVSNFATIISTGNHTAVSIYGGPGTVTNGATNDKIALITGSTGVYLGDGGTVTNYGTITGQTHAAITLETGGVIINGGATDTVALIDSVATSGTHSGISVDLGPATIINYGSISSTTASGVDLTSGGTVTNGTSTDTTALITSLVTGGSHAGIYFGVVPAIVTNFGTIRSASAQAVNLAASGGVVTNGSAADDVATLTGTGVGIAAVQFGGATSTLTNFGFVSGSLGVFFDSGTTGTVVNAGTITGTTGDAIMLSDGGRVTNGSATDIVSSIDAGSGSGTGIYVSAVPGTVTNFGSVTAPGDVGIILQDGGIITNGTASDTKASVVGANNNSAIIVKGGSATITNFGTLNGEFGVTFSAGATGTVVNAGKIVSTTGSTGTALSFSTGTSRLVVDPGASFTGHVTTGNGTDTLELAGTAAGTLSGLGSQFTGFGTVIVDATADWTLTGANTAATVDNLGTLILAASGALDVTGSVAAASTGTFELSNLSTLTIAADPAAGDKMKFLGSSELVIGNASSFGLNVGTPSYTGPLIESFVVGDSIDLSNVEAQGAVLNYSTATGLLQVTNGSTHPATLEFQNSTLGAGTFHPGADSAGHLLITLV